MIFLMFVCFTVLWYIMKKILYVSTFKDEYDESVFIQKRKKEVLKHFERKDCVVHFIHNAPGKKPLSLVNGVSFYHPLLYCNVSDNKLKLVHNLLFKYSALYSKITIKGVLKILPEDINDYDLIVAESWEIAYSLISCVAMKKIVVRIYGTTDLTERIENNFFWRVNPFFRKVKEVVNSHSMRSIIFNSTGSRSRDLFELLSDSDNGPEPVYLNMPNIIYSKLGKKQRMLNGTINLLHVGRMKENRGFDTTLKVIDILKNSLGLPIKAVLVGDGKVRNKLQNMCCKLDIADCVHFTGKINKNLLIEQYGKADILINYYGFNPVLEALNSNVFVITREFGEMSLILERYYSDKVYRVCQKNLPIVNIKDENKSYYIKEVVAEVVWYSKHYQTIRDEDFSPKITVDLHRFGQKVYSYYNKVLFN